MERYFVWCFTNLPWIPTNEHEMNTKNIFSISFNTSILHLSKYSFCVRWYIKKHLKILFSFQTYHCKHNCLTRTSISSAVLSFSRATRTIFSSISRAWVSTSSTSWLSSTTTRYWTRDPWSISAPPTIN